MTAVGQLLVFHESFPVHSVDWSVSTSRDEQNCADGAEGC